MQYVLTWTLNKQGSLIEIFDTQAASALLVLEVSLYIHKNKTTFGKSVDVIYEAMEKQRKTQIMQKILVLIQDLCSMY